MKKLLPCLTEQVYVGIVYSKIYKNRSCSPIGPEVFLQINKQI